MNELCDAVAPIIMAPHKYVLAMPNTGPIRTIDEVAAYWEKLCGIRDMYGYQTEFVMTLYFTDLLTPQVIEKLASLPFRCEVKYYPFHPKNIEGTTGSGEGIPLDQGDEILKAMSECRIPFLIHGETVLDTNNRELPHAKREGYFLTHEYPRFREKHPDLLTCIEHASTALAVKTVQDDDSGNTTLTATPHHLLFVMQELLKMSWCNNGRCMPYLKTPDDRDALCEFVFSGDRRAIAGDDTAPHLSASKQGAFEDAACGCWLPHATGLYVMAAERHGALNDDFVHFMCYNGADWRGLPRPKAGETTSLLRLNSPHDIPDPRPVAELNDVVVPLGWTDQADRLQIGIGLLDQMHCDH